MSILETTIAGYTLSKILMGVGTVLLGGLLYWFMGNKEAQKKFNKILERVIQKSGASKDEIYDEEEMREKVDQALKNDTEMTDHTREVTIDHIMQEIGAIESQAKALGREEERMKGEDSDSVYNLAIMNLAFNSLTLLLLIYVHII